ncbi:MAG TPA: hypothetical protein VHR66_12885 [Gemmataceae bacterium]|jgi:hypothetical protein|nr:hypothetical protein [Gemmataceae bacterium]
MTRRFTSRQIVLGYSLAGLLVGIGLAVWLFHGNFETWYREVDGSLTRTPKPGKEVVRIDRSTGRIRLVEVGGTTRVSLLERLGYWLWDSAPCLIVSAATGFFWGLAHLKVQAAMRDTLGDHDRINYDDSINEYRPPVST